MTIPYHNRISGLDAIHELMWIGTADPAATPANDVQAHQFWLNTTGGATLEAGAILNERNAGNTAWTARCTLGTAAARNLDTDGTLAANSDTKIATQKATKTYVDAAVITATIPNDSITDAKLRNSVALSVIGRSANSTGDPGDIAASADHQVLKRTGTAVGFGLLLETDLPAPSMTTLTDGATVTWDVTGKREDMAQLTIAGARTLAITGAAAGFRGALHITESGASRSLALPGGSIVANSGAGAIALTGADTGKQKWTVSYDGSHYWWEQGASYT
jgi:hypothetical protein